MKLELMGDAPFLFYGSSNIVLEDWNRKCYWCGVDIGVDTAMGFYCCGVNYFIFEYNNLFDLETYHYMGKKHKLIVWGWIKQ